MRTLIVEPSVLSSVADQLDDLADHPPVRATEIHRCRQQLEAAWSGGIAADLADQRLRDLATRAEVMLLDAQGDGRLIVAFGDPRTCRNIATYVPGAGASLTNIADELERARMLRERAGPDTSVIMWLGYDPPDFADAILLTAARKAAEPLRRFQAELVANHDGEIGQMTVVGHSYGSVVVGLAERGGDLAADDIVVLGSPGMGVARASHLRDPAQVWSSTAPNDPIKFAPGFILGRDPDDRAFGARTFASAPFGHSGYFHPTNPALNTLAKLVRGDPLPQ